MIQKRTKLLRYIAHIIVVSILMGILPAYAEVENNSMKGFNTHFTHFKDTENDLDLIYNSGAETIRDSIYWHWVEYSEGLYSWGEYDWWLNELNNNDKDIYIVVTATTPPDFYYTDDTKAFFSTEKEREAFCTFLKALVRRYPFIDYIELWNEPNYGFGTNVTDEERMKCYADMVKEASRAIREVSSDIEIVGGCIALEDDPEAPRIDGETFMQTVLPQIYPYIDAVSWHTYVVKKNAEGTLMQERIDKVKDILTACGGWKKIYTSETGWVTGDITLVSVTEEKQAYNIAKIFPVMEENNIDGTLIYDFRNDGEDTTNTEHNFGLINYDRTIKPSYTYFKEHIDKTKNYTHVGEYSESGYEVHLYVGENDAVEMKWETPTGLLKEYTSNKPSYVENVTLSEAKDSFKAIISAKYDELSSKASSSDFNISDNIAQIKSYIENSNEDEAYYGNYDLGMTLLNMQLSEDINIENEQLSDLLYDIYQIGKRMSAVYDIENTASEDDILKLEKKYEAVEDALVTFEDEKVFLSDAMLNIGREKLNEAKTNVCKKQSGDNYALSGAGKLKVYGDAPAGSYVSVKIEKGENLVYVNTVGADAYNKYEFEFELNDDGIYNVLLVDAEGEPKSFTVTRESNFLFEEFIQAEYIVDYARKMLLVTGCDELTTYVEWGETDDKICAEFDIQNGNQKQNLNVILAKYKDNILVECDAMPVEILAGENKTENLSVEADKDAIYKVFVWDKNLKPYSTVLE